MTAENDNARLRTGKKPGPAVATEQVDPGQVFSPSVDIFETERQITLLADLPGVPADRLSIDLRGNILTLNADVAPTERENEQYILAEFQVGKFYRRFVIPGIIDQEKIEARLKDGVLRLTLTKATKSAARTIKVSTG